MKIKRFHDPAFAGFFISMSFLILYTCINKIDILNYRYITNFVSRNIFHYFSIVFLVGVFLLDGTITIYSL